MRLPFLLKRNTKSSDNFDQLGSATSPASASTSTDTLSATTPRTGSPLSTPPPPPPPQSRPRNHSAAAHPSIAATQRHSQAQRPHSVLLSQPGSPLYALYPGQLDEDLGMIMDDLGVHGDQRQAMQQLPRESKLQILHTHRIKQNTPATGAAALSDHLAALARCTTQSLPLARVERLRRDILYQSVQQINAFVADGGLRLLLAHLAQLNERSRAARRADEYAKEHEILRCIWGAAKVDSGARWLVDGGCSQLRPVLSSVATAWPPCATTALRIIAGLVPESDAVFAALFRRRDPPAGDLKGPGSQQQQQQQLLPFDEWMGALDLAIGEIRLQTGAHAGDLLVASLALLEVVCNCVCRGIDRRVRLYAKLAAHDMLCRLALLGRQHRGGGAPGASALLARWEEAVQRDYNAARSVVAAGGPVVVLEGAGDSRIRDVAAFRAFVENYNDIRAAVAEAEAEAEAEAGLHMGMATQPVAAADEVSGLGVQGIPAAAAAAVSVDAAAGAANAADLAALLAGLRDAHAALKHASLGMPPGLPGCATPDAEKARRELQSIARLAESMLATI
ncbi:hypothetical protein LPJ66_008829 [Kickxella alabastrina]|uniref:Uncharacterized protein n=1 Tax=Kickxella alabastrina TaxID=61397 RepID=A0ACC1I4Z1_9FUNG|nr:hypothetical protein LPJ66_008829 [Kickxella alabastrina]